MGSSKKHKDRDRDEKRHKHKRDKDRDDKDRDDKDRGDKDRGDRREKKRHKHRHRRSRSRSPRDDREEFDKRERHERKKKHRREKHSSASDEDAGPLQKTLVEEMFQLVKEEIDGHGRDSKKGNKTIPADTDAGQTIKAKKESSPIVESRGSGYVESLSIADTNKIRAKLGLPPLEVGGVVNQASTEGGEAAKKEDEDVHKPAINLGEKKKAEEIKAKLALIKEKRKINQKLKKVKKLADAEEDLDDVTAWVERSRKSQIEKDMAAKRAKMLAEMDEEFGVGELVENEFAPEKEVLYSSKHIRDLKVLHSVGSFKEGKNVILTLKDADILGEDEDELMNVNILDDEKAAKNVELRKKKKDYRPYEDDTIDEYGMMKSRDVLTKYNEEIDGAKVESFRLGESTSIYEDEEKRLERIRANLQAQAVSLDFKVPTLASEYYTPTEMEAFKPKKKKVRRKIKRKFTVDDLTPGDDDAYDDHGSRGRMRCHPGEDSIADNKENNLLEGQEKQQQPMDMDVDLPDVDQSAIMGPDEEAELYLGPPIEDEAEQELQMVLSKARKLKLKKAKSQSKVEEKIAEELSKIKQEPMDTESAAPPIVSSLLSSSGASAIKGINITLNSTSEFCRTLGEIPTYGLAGNREEDEEEILEFEREAREMEHLGDDGGQEGWSTVNLEQEEDTYTGDVAGPVLEEEPTVQTGIAGALNLAMKKGYIEQEFIKSTPKSKKGEEMEAKNFTVEDKNYNDIDAKYNKHDRYRGPLADFKEKDSYKPDVQLKYVDDNGREINQKEAFRILSHRFHGKGSGKMKTDKRAKKQLEEESMKKMSSTDTPLNTVAMMKLKQKQTQSPFILLSGGSKSLTANTLAK